MTNVRGVLATETEMQAPRLPMRSNTRRGRRHMHPLHEEEVVVGEEGAEGDEVRQRLATADRQRLGTACPELESLPNRVPIIEEVEAVAITQGCRPER
ncbi:hypothetical protein PMIN06_001364 [Paraphaeosphaeria minitans]